MIRKLLNVTILLAACSVLISCNKDTKVNVNTGNTNVGNISVQKVITGDMNKAKVRTTAGVATLEEYYEYCVDVSVGNIEEGDIDGIILNDVLSEVYGAFPNQGTIQDDKGKDL